MGIEGVLVGRRRMGALVEEARVEGRMEGEEEVGVLVRAEGEERRRNFAVDGVEGVRADIEDTVEVGGIIFAWGDFVEREENEDLREEANGLVR